MATVLILWQNIYCITMWYNVFLVLIISLYCTRKNYCTRTLAGPWSGAVVPRPSFLHWRRFSWVANTRRVGCDSGEKYDTFMIISFFIEIKSKCDEILNDQALSQLSICIPSPLRNGHIYMKDARCAETNEESIFPFWFFEIWSFKILRFFWEKKNHSKRCKMFWNRIFSSWVFFAILVFEI